MAPARFSVVISPAGGGGEVSVRTDIQQKYGPEGLGTVVEPARFLFNDVDAATAEKSAATLIARPILTSPLTDDPYANLPCTYLVLEKDMTLPMEYQEGMVASHNAKYERRIALLRDAIEAFGRQLLA
ncbi:uncharacterized protein N7459_006564 [Penicillium hispanicum]|uniref:uncharacterized protein n=1 Tax=Penicillium hispanicum TaxID=1080232 RepID=UPI00253F675D|nr:uncharacterized protein N7459_006564 [Penicillium hispanicum]KAJ5577600.1 hypothetical protein N7459_006564 [Penicillium hispanicum]